MKNQSCLSIKGQKSTALSADCQQILIHGHSWCRLLLNNITAELKLALEGI